MRDKEVCQVLGLGRMTIYRLRIAGELKARKLPGGRIGYLESDVQAYLRNLPIHGSAGTNEAPNA